MKLRVPLMLKIAIPLVLIISATIGIITLRMYQAIEQRWQSDLDARLLRTIEITNNSLDRDLLHQLKTPTDIDLPAYETIRQQLYQTSSLANVGYLTLYFVRGNKLSYWVDSGETGIDYPFFYPTANHFKAFREKTIQKTEYSDEYGSYYAIVAPLYDTDGTSIIGLIESTATNESRTLMQREAIQIILPIALTSLLIGLILVSLIIWFTMNRPLRRLRRGALKLAQGNFGHEIPVYSVIDDEITNLTRTFNTMSNELATLYQKQREQERLAHEVRIARQIQQRMLPDELPSITGLDIAAVCLPQRETSGDFYDFIVQPQGVLDIVIGDVSGKSIPAAMVMVAGAMTVRALASPQHQPSLILKQSNTVLLPKIPRSMFAAVSYARFNVQEHTIEWCNAGQLHPIILRANPAKPQIQLDYLYPTLDALPLGLMEHDTFADASGIINRGDLVLFYTDGIVEAMDEDQQLYGFERLETLLQTVPTTIESKALIEVLLADMQTFVGSATQHDDITLIAIKFT